MQLAECTCTMGQEQPMYRCHALATQEDFFCDECRYGACRIIRQGDRHVRHPWLDHEHRVWISENLQNTYRVTGG